MDTIELTEIPTGVSELAGNNKVINSGDAIFRSSVIRFSGKNNVLYVADGARQIRSSINFLGDSSVAYIGSSTRNATITADIYHESVLYIGRELSTNGVLKLSLSERKSIIIGDDCMFSYGIFLRTSDPHLLYSTSDYTRINPSQSVIVGDHVWISQNVLMLKGASIGSGSVIGANSILSKAYPSNVAVAGAPARVVREDIFWKRPSVHAYTAADSESSMQSDPGLFIFDDVNGAPIVQKLDAELDALRSPTDRLDWCLVKAKHWVNSENETNVSEGDDFRCIQNYRLRIQALFKGHKNK